MTLESTNTATDPDSRLDGTQQQQQAADPAPDPAKAADPAPDPAKAADPAADPNQPPAGETKPKGPWFQRRLDQLAEERRNARAAAAATQQENEQLRAENERLRAGGKPAAPAGAPPAGEDVVAQARQMAAQIAAEDRFAEGCNRVYAEGSKTYGAAFDDSLRLFGTLGGMPRPLLDVVNELPKGHEVLHQLAQDPEEAARVFQLPPTRMAVELARIEAQLGRARPASNAPNPIRTIGGTNKSEPTLETETDTQKWMELREADLAKRKRR